ncbi:MULTISPECIES: GNAT family N-acetyltransferase [Streptomyces]|uniref:GNAT family N-acetyltransferase n=1 Tax=Streptomyces TaxID=1883 RepID=UPI000CD4B327|nr:MULTISPECIES: GNAT family N-acetyltransferase [Streptomyces]
MTTTLRPSGPEQRDEAGARSRRYALLDNGRPVGFALLGAGAPGTTGADVGHIHELTVEPAERRVGRGTVAALAAEEVLRGWGCRSVEVRFRPAEDGAVRMAAQLGYTELSRNMVTEVRPGAADTPLALPEGVTLREMSAEEYPEWLVVEREEFVRSWTDRGVPEERATAHAERSYTRLLPEGPVTPGTVLRVLESGGALAGALWVRTGEELPDGAGGYVYSVRVEAGHRGRGLGRALMVEAERICAEAGVDLLGLHVFAGNTPALSLYESLGYRTVWLNQVKRLG